MDVKEQRSGDVAEATLREHGAGQKLFGRYTLVKILGRGGMGVVWLAHDEELEREVALKFLPDLIIHDRALLDELKRETKRSLELTHKNIVRIHDFVHDERSACISMEYIDGETLSNLRAQKEGKVFEPDELAPWIAQLCDALDYAHNHARIIHRDLKPANLMVNERGDLKISDFGIARSLGDSLSKLTMEQGRSGTLAYMSPQQLDGERATHLDDIYSLGATIYDLLTSKPPFYSGNIDRQIHERAAPPMTERRKDLNIEPALVPPVWEDTVAACLAKDPAHRPQSASEIAQRLQLSSAKTGTVALGRARRVHPKMVVAGGIAALSILALAGLYFGVPKRQAKPVSQATAIPEKSIAVLPFENRSEDKANAYFADGIQDEILTNLARIADLKVISRTSVMPYKTGIARNLREIGQQLGVAHLLEGSVQRAANRVRVNAQLIDTRTDAHLWAQTYDRDLADVFAIQSEIAKAIADQLQARLSPNEKAAIEKPPTTDLAAFDLYSRAKALVFPATYGEQDVRQAIELLNQAVTRDPSFFEAYCQLVYLHAVAYSTGIDHTAGRLALADAALQAAVRLRPDAGETHLTRANYLYFGHRDYAGALAELETARRSLPNDPRIFELTGYILRRRGQQEEGLRNLEKALELDPRNDSIMASIAGSYQSLRRYPEEAAILDRSLTIHPNDPATKVARTMLEFYWKADTRPGHQMIESIVAENPGVISENFFASWWFGLALAERDPIAAERALVALGDNFPDNLCWGDEEIILSRSFGEGLLARMIKDEAKARTAFSKARAEQEKIVQAQPDHAAALCVLGLIDAALGRKEAALEEGRRATELLPVEKDSINGSAMIQYFAVIAAWTGEKDVALQQLEIGLRVPFASIVVSYGALKSLPFWDPLRGDPRFEKIVASLAPKAAP